MEQSVEGEPSWKHITFFKSVHTGLKKVLFKEYESNIPEIIFKKRDEITQYEKEHKWELAKKLANPYEMVYTQEEKFPYPNISVVKPLSRSYFKMIEMLYVTNFLNELPKDKNIRSAHIAEGPGGFMQAIIDVAEKEHRTIKKMYAITLKSDKYYIPGWKKSTYFLKKYSDIINISYGKDGTGDIYIKENQDNFIKNINVKVNIFTADGGFDFSLDYTQQEKQIFSLLVCSFIIGIQTLGINGMCIIKIFDTYSSHTKSLISICGSLFKQYTLYKPATSRPCNSERYFIGKEFKGLNKQVLDILKIIYENSLKNNYPYFNLDDNEYNFIENISKLHEKKQIEFIDLAKEFAKNNELYKSYYKDNLNKSYNFCKDFNIVTKPMTSMMNSV
uniref:Ribosomal RNA methyltransferase FtsJ domain-containing protein n=1 Tax=viral metagenome TaxID=1070528 RepID=A0A6C0D6U7_9ZZZZ